MKRMMCVLGMAMLVISPASAQDESKGKNQASIKMQAMNNAKKIALAVHLYYDKTYKLPGDICDASGKPLLSWRVAILPYMNQEVLYKKFKLDEPWDSQHNKPLAAAMPAVFEFDENDKKHGTTPFLGWSGQGTIFEKGKALSFSAVSDGTSNTLMFVEGARSVPWSKPGDLAFDSTKPLPTLGGRVEKYFLAAMCDGSVRYIPLTVDATTLKALITRAGGEIVEIPE